MPTKPVRKTAASSRQPVDRSGNTKIFVFILTLVVIAGAIAWWVMKDRGEGALKAKTAGNSVSSSQESPVIVISTEVGLAVARAKLQLESTDNKDSIKVVIDKALGMDGREVNYKFDWTVNGQPSGDGGERITGFKRGDRVAVAITPFEGERAGTSRLLEFLVNNTSPKIEENKDMKFDGKRLSYQVKGSDLDGDELTYVLDDAPEGMTIDPKTGLVNWQPKEGDSGERAVKVKVSDAKGAATSYSFKITLPKADDKAAEPQK
ncbi:MAG: Ig domain-containing protein [Syntrophorhabdaceae bacterium]